jgi:polyhydroxyalkanoate synthesis repressor PhaR
MRIIKKYPNRRLYDTSVGSYITLENIRLYVLKHIQFQIVDAKTNKDLTQSTLLQIISEQEASTSSIFSTALLEQFIRSYHHKSQSLVKQYLEQAIHLFTEQTSLFDQQLQQFNKIHQSLKSKTPKKPKSKK